ncbi:hypothetical protein HK098_001093 [Nowakowskiella sp. JEL0407]|nr:hypothetical protein HK098_001093 [Nowakowskiella sp. JEL0407]
MSALPTFKKTFTIFLPSSPAPSKIYVTGTFDSWAKSFLLSPSTETKSFEPNEPDDSTTAKTDSSAGKIKYTCTVDLLDTFKPGEKIYYKFVIAWEFGETWCVDENEQTEYDESGNLNNYFMRENLKLKDSGIHLPVDKTLFVVDSLNSPDTNLFSHTAVETVEPATISTVDQVADNVIGDNVIGIEANAVEENGDCERNTVSSGEFVQIESETESILPNSHRRVPVGVWILEVLKRIKDSCVIL